MKFFKPSLKIALLLGMFNYVSAQDAEPDTTYWHRGFKGTLTFTQVNLTNWASGGENSVSLSSFINTYLNHAKGRITWENSLDLAYGFVDQEEIGSRKTDDKIQALTKIGYQLSPTDKKWYWSSGLGFTSQFADGFAFPNDSVSISKFFAPAYLIMTSGLEYKPSDKFSAMYSPVTGKVTFVSDQRLADAGAFGVDPAEFDNSNNLIKSGENTRVELGTYLIVKFNDEVWENVNVESRLQLFTSYLRNFGEIDVNWEISILMKVNKFLSASLSTQLLYDKDIEFPVFDAANNQIGVEDKWQFKEIFGIGLSYAIKSK